MTRGARIRFPGRGFHDSRRGLETLRPCGTGARHSWSTVGARRLAWATVLSVYSLLGGCSGDSGKVGNPSASTSAVTRTASSAPVTVTVSVDREQLDLAQRAVVTVDITADRSVTLTDADFEKALVDGDRQFQYRVVEAKKSPLTRATDGQLRSRQHYELEFFVAGEYELPPMKVAFAEPSAAEPSLGTMPKTDADATEVAPSEVRKLETEPIKLVVLASPGTQIPPEQLRKVERLEPVDLPSRWEKWRWALAAGVATIAIGLWVLWGRLRRGRSVIEPPIPAHEWARREIAWLIAEDLVARGRIQEFYYRVSAIVRGYIERRFGLAAPEMTTEEFLEAAAGDSRLGYIGTEPLGEFLTSCDLVKFARHEPGSRECDQVLRTASEFVERTREHAPPSAASSAASPTVQERAA